MELLSKTNNAIKHSPQGNQNGEDKNAERLLLAGFLDSLNEWESNGIPVINTPINQNGPNSILPPGIEPSASNLQYMEPSTSALQNIEASVSALRCMELSKPNLTCSGSVTSKNSKPSPESNSSSIRCMGCDINAVVRCLDCNEFLCQDCSNEHIRCTISSPHSIVHLPQPIGTSPIYQNKNQSKHQCDLHNDVFRFVCETCNKLVCRCCTFREHKEHTCTSIQSFVENSSEKINAALESSNLGAKCIKGSIDKALTFIRQLERNCNELSENIRKTFRQILVTIEDRERFFLDFVEKLRNRKLALLHDQMAGLKSILSELSETSEMLYKVVDNTWCMDEIELALKIINIQRQLEQFAAIYKDLKPKHEVFAFFPPDFNLINDLRTQGAVVSVDEKYLSNSTSVVQGMQMIPTVQTRRPILHDSPLQLPITVNWPYNSSVGWDLSLFRTSPTVTNLNASRNIQCIPGCLEKVTVRNSTEMPVSFGLEGHEDGQVSRPWGVCVDKNSNIYVSDRRNNRVQVFYSNGSLKFKFGRKGVGNGEFDLPAGICLDCDNRIIVVDKDNHRVQIFTANGLFLLKFGCYGKEHGQFQYPWDVAVNSRQQIVVTDSRNHRIQQFDSEGRFIRQVVFENSGPSRGTSSPRGVCYTPQGNIIVSDFDNHCLYLIDPDVNEILSMKGQEGPGIQEFNRPSGLCCDDDGNIIVADSKNQRVTVFSPTLHYKWVIEIRPSHNSLMPTTIDEKDRACDVALMPDGRIVFLIELSPDSKEGCNPNKTFIHIF